MTLAFSVRYWLPALLLAGCATDTYWTRVYEPLSVEHVVHVDFPCGKRELLGCWNPVGRTIELRKGMSASLERCVLSHEKKHADGFVHPEPRAIVAYIDCGDGTTCATEPQWQRVT